MYWRSDSEDEYRYIRDYYAERYDEPWSSSDGYNNEYQYAYGRHEESQHQYEDEQSDDASVSSSSSFVAKLTDSDSLGILAQEHHRDTHVSFVRSEYEEIPSLKSIKKSGCITFEPGSQIQEMKGIVLPLVCVHVPESVRCLGSQCFSDLSSLRCVTFAVNSQLQSIEKLAFARTSIEAISFPAALESLDWSCFCGCSSLKRVVFESESRLKKIWNSEQKQTMYREYGGYGGYYGYEQKLRFRDSSSPLDRLEIPASVEEIGKEVFCDSVAPSEIIFAPGSCLKALKTGVFSGCHNMRSIEVPASVEVIDEMCFANMRSTFDVRFQLGSRLREIRKKAFYMSSVNSIQIPATVEVIGEDCFEECRNLRMVMFEAGSCLEKLPDHCFSGCGSLEYVNIPSKVTVIPPECFMGCELLKGVTFESISSIKEIMGSAFAMSGITEIEIAASVESIGDKCFSECKNLRTVVFAAGSSLKSIPESAFRGTRIGDIVIPASVEKIGQSAFAGCMGLKRVITEDNSCLQELGEKAFADCIQLCVIEIPRNVEVIPDSCFRCGIDYPHIDFFDNAKDIKVPLHLRFHKGSQLREIQNMGFACSCVKSIEIPATVEKIGIRCFTDCTSLVSVKFESGSRLAILPPELFQGCRSLSQISIPEAVWSIGDRCFEDCVSLNCINFESRCLREITDGAFAGSGLVQINIPVTVRTIGVKAFEKCSLLQTVEFAENSEIKRICDAAFSQCSRLTSIIIPASVESIGSLCFYSCSSLTTVAFEPGSSLTSMGGFIFNRSGVTDLCVPACVREFHPQSLSNVAPAGRADKNAAVELVARIISDDEMPLVSWNIRFDSKYSPEWTLPSIQLSLIKSIEIPASITQIQSNSFIGCRIEALKFQEGSRLTVIKAKAFVKSRIDNIEIPPNLNVIEDCAFVETRIGNIRVHADNKCYMTCGPTFLTSDGRQLIRCSSIVTSIEIPATVQVIDKQCFRECTNLTSITFANGLAMSQLDLAIFNSPKITKITVPACIAAINDRTKNVGLKQLTEVVFAPNSVLTRVGKCAFAQTNIQSIELPASVEVIGDHCFRDSTSLVSINIRMLSRLKEIGKFGIAFTNISDITIPASLTTLGRGCFAKCEKLQRVAFEPYSMLKTLDEFTFAYSSITSIEIPANVEVIAKGCFAYCESLTDVIFQTGSRLGEIGRYAFYRTGLTGIHIPRSVQAICEWCFAWCTSMTRVTFEGGSCLQSIGQKAFYELSSIREITIPARLEEIPTHCFARVSAPGDASTPLTVKFEYGSRLIKLGYGAFQNAHLTSIVIPPAITTIWIKCFSGCRLLQSVAFDGGWNLEMLAKLAFEKTSITRLHIPGKPQIQHGCFYGCPRGLESQITFANPYTSQRRGIRKVPRVAFEGPSGYGSNHYVDFDEWSGVYIDNYTGDVEYYDDANIDSIVASEFKSACTGSTSVLSFREQIRAGML